MDSEPGGEAEDAPSMEGRHGGLPTAGDGPVSGYASTAGAGERIVT